MNERAQIEAMSSSPAPERHPKDEISVVAAAAVLLRRWRLILLLPFLAGLLAFVVAVSRPPTYAAQSAFIAQSGQGSSSQLPGVARQLGLSLGDFSRGEPLQLYTRLLESEDLLRAAVLSTYTIPASSPQPEGERSLVDYYYSTSDEVPAGERTKGAVQRLKNQIRATSDPAAGVINLRTEADSPELAEEINRQLLDLLNQFNLDRRQSQAAAERAFIESRLETARGELREAEQELKRFYEQNRRFEQSPDLRLEENRLQQRMALHQQLHATLAQAYEQARIDEVRNTPVITVIDEPEASATRAGLGVRVPVMLALFFGGVLAVGIAFSSEYIAKLRAENTEEFAELIKLRREILPGGVRRLFTRTGQSLRK